MRVLTVIIGWAWVAFWMYWIFSASQSKKNSVPGSVIFFLPRLGLLLLALVFGLLYSHIPQSLIRSYSTLEQHNFVLLIGFMIFAFGVYLAIWARLVLGANWGMPMTQKQDPQLVTSGIYGYIRHPIYSGVLLMSLGSFLAVNYYWSLVFIVAAIYFVYSARVEERLMKKQFPTAYPAYMKRAKMLIPFIF